MPDAPFQFASGPTRLKPPDLVPGVWVTDGKRRKVILTGAAMPVDRDANGNITAEWSYLRDEQLVRILVPRIVQLHTDGSQTVRHLQIAIPGGMLVELEAGEHNVPESFADHWYLAKNNVQKLGPAYAPVPQPTAALDEGGGLTDEEAALLQRLLAKASGQKAA